MYRMRTLVIYVFHEFNDRVDYFIKHALFDDETVDFLFVCNNLQLQQTIALPYYAAILFRENLGYDFAAWSYALFQNDIYKKYDNYIFVNSSVMGPYLDPQYNGKWTDIYIDRLTESVRLFGSTINTEFFLRKDIDPNLHPVLFSHIQSYIYSMKQDTLHYLIECGIFSKDNHSTNFHKTIENKEVGMSRKIIENNWNIGCLMPIYKDVDFRFIYKKPQDYPHPFLPDIMDETHVNKHFTPRQLVFIKGNRCPHIPPPHLFS
jgi:lipopolysaccharide biosynthesis protein